MYNKAVVLAVAVGAFVFSATAVYSVMYPNPVTTMNSDYALVMMACDAAAAGGKFHQVIRHQDGSQSHCP
jgi:hypothetical protein